jgi:hypothetical protein
VLKSYVPEVLSLFASSRVEKFGWFVERFGMDLSNIGFVEHIGMGFSRVLDARGHAKAKLVSGYFCLDCPSPTLAVLRKKPYTNSPGRVRNSLAEKHPFLKGWGPLLSSGVRSPPFLRGRSPLRLCRLIPSHVCLVKAEASPEPGSYIHPKRNSVPAPPVLLTDREGITHNAKNAKEHLRGVHRQHQSNKFVIR